MDYTDIHSESGNEVEKEREIDELKKKRNKKKSKMEFNKRRNVKNNNNKNLNEMGVINERRKNENKHESDLRRRIEAEMRVKYELRSQRFQSHFLAQEVSHLSRLVVFGDTGMGKHGSLGVGPSPLSGAGFGCFKTLREAISEHVRRSEIVRHLELLGIKLDRGGSYGAISNAPFRVCCKDLLYYGFIKYIEKVEKFMEKIFQLSLEEKEKILSKLNITWNDLFHKNELILLKDLNKLMKLFMDLVIGASVEHICSWFEWGCEQAQILSATPLSAQWQARATQTLPPVINRASILYSFGGNVMDLKTLRAEKLKPAQVAQLARVMDISENVLVGMLDEKEKKKQWRRAYTQRTYSNSNNNSNSNNDVSVTKSGANTTKSGFSRAIPRRIEGVCKYGKNCIHLQRGNCYYTQH